MDGSQVVSFLPANYTYRTDPKELCGAWKSGCKSGIWKIS